ARKLARTEWTERGSDGTSTAPCSQAQKGKLFQEPSVRLCCYWQVSIPPARKLARPELTLEVNISDVGFSSLTSPSAALRPLVASLHSSPWKPIVVMVVSPLIFTSISMIFMLPPISPAGRSPC